jgi:hypothetical protein
MQHKLYNQIHHHQQKYQNHLGNSIEILNE